MERGEVRGRTVTVFIAKNAGTKASGPPEMLEARPSSKGLLVVIVPEEIGHDVGGRIAGVIQARDPESGFNRLQ